MRVDDLRIGQTVQWHSDLVAEVPPGRIIGMKEKFSRSPDLRIVDVHVWFDRPVLTETHQLWVLPKTLTLIETNAWTGREGEEDEDDA